MVWFAACCIASLVIRELGVRSLKKYPLTTILLILSLASLPFAGFMKVSKPYRSRISAMIFTVQSPAVTGVGCPIYPPDNIWNRRVTDLPLDPNSATYMTSMGPNDPLHADFGPIGGYRFAVTDGTDSAVDVEFGGGGPESDKGPYRIPENAPVEEGGDAHVLVMDRGNCLLYEFFGSVHTGPYRWQADSAAIFDLRSNKLRPNGWTAADAAGTAILPGLARYEEVEKGVIAHALRFTTGRTRRATVWPARHFASVSNDPNLPPMGLRVRLKANVDISGYSRQTQIVLTALKQYGMILSDNGGNWYMSGSRDSRWSSSLIRELKTLHGSDLEAVDSSGVMIDPDSGQARQ